MVLSITVAGITLNAVCNITLDRDDEGKIIQYNPKDDYDNTKNLSLNKYGHGPFCRFHIEGHQHEKGVYLIRVDKKPQYAGQTHNLYYRFKSDYGNISPKNCYKGGQSTNCKVNNKILTAYKKGCKIEVFFKETPRLERPGRKKIESRIIKELDLTKKGWNEHK
jgi:hypothetical protein